jgi:predicted MPP superfamily phosphohydrolase
VRTSRQLKNREPPLPFTRRKFLYLAATAGAGAIALDSTVFEPNRPRVVKVDLPLGRWPERLNGFTVALLSDFHYDPGFSVHPIHAAIGMVNDLHPDLIALAGDFVSMPLFDGDDEKAARTAEPCAHLLTQMRSTHGLWAVMGNHDYYTNPRTVTALLEAEGIHVLANRSSAIETDGARFWLAGVNDVQSQTANLDQTLYGVPKVEATILLAHEPDYADQAARFPIDLQLSGHSHGGQIRIPFMGPLYLPELARKYVWGMYRVGNLSLYTNPGLGTVGLPVRLHCPPEITLLTLRRGA